jgi:hypothetical protein
MPVIICDDLILKKNHCLNLSYVKANCFHRNLVKNYVQANCFRQNSVSNCAKVKSFRSSGKEPVNCCAEEQSKYLNVQVASWYYFVEPVCFDLSAHGLACCCLAVNRCGYCFLRQDCYCLEMLLVCCYSAHYLMAASCGTLAKCIPGLIVDGCIQVKYTIECCARW